MCPVLRSWFNPSPISCPRTIFCDHFGEDASQPENCCVYHHKTLPSMDPTESQIQQFSPSHTRTLMARSDGTYVPFKNDRFRDSALRMIAVWARQTWEQVRGEDTLLPSTAFFSEALQKRLSEKIHVVTSIEHLCSILHDWHHLDSHKFKLFKFCQELVKSLDHLRQEVQDPPKSLDHPRQKVQDQPKIGEDKVEKTLKINISALKQRVGEEDLTDVRPPKRQCKEWGTVKKSGPHL